jgi:citrate lyase subunit beta/citryl-CoA lyase
MRPRHSKRSADSFGHWGFAARPGIHPAQVPAVNRAFAPSAAEVEWARRVVIGSDEAAAQGREVFALDGAMVDEPVIKRARRVLMETDSTR